MMCVGLTSPDPDPDPVLSENLADSTHTLSSFPNTTASERRHLWVDLLEKDVLTGNEVPKVAGDDVVLTTLETVTKDYSSYSPCSSVPSPASFVSCSSGTSLPPEVTRVQIINKNQRHRSPFAPLGVADTVLGQRVIANEVPLPSPDVPVALMCEVCGKTFTKAWVLEKHHRTAHKDAMLKTDDERCKCGKIVAGTDTSHFCFQCVACKTVLPERLLLKEHMLNCQKRKQLLCEICGTVFFDKNAKIKHEIECKMNNPGDTANVKQLICPYCTENVKSRLALRRHEDGNQLHSHSCPICKIQFCLLRTLFSHITKIHRGCNSIKFDLHCPMCDKRFQSLKKYIYHIVDIHESNTNNSGSDIPRNKVRRTLTAYRRLCIKKSRGEDFEEPSQINIHEYSQLEAANRRSSRTYTQTGSSLSSLMGQVKRS